MKPGIEKGEVTESKRTDRQLRELAVLGKMLVAAPYVKHVGETRAKLSGDYGGLRVSVAGEKRGALLLKLPLPFFYLNIDLLARDERILASWHVGRD